jgi:hypothetical protein
MNKAEAWSHFIENYAKEYSTAQIMALMMMLWLSLMY